MKGINNKDQWIEDVMASTSGMKKAMPHADLFDSVSANLNSARNTNNITFPVKQWVAAAVLLVAVNAASAIYFARQNNTSKNNTTNPVAAEMRSETTYNY